MAEKNGPSGTPVFDTQDPPEKVYVGPFLRSFAANEAHKLFSRVETLRPSQRTLPYTKKVWRSNP